MQIEANDQAHGSTTISRDTLVLDIIVGSVREVFVYCPRPHATSRSHMLQIFSPSLEHTAFWTFAPLHPTPDRQLFSLIFSLGVFLSASVHTLTKLSVHAT
jgi:hypothetical protein